MSKSRGCKTFKHVECEYNACRGRVVSRGHAEDCPFQLSEDEASSDEGEYSESENMYGGWKPVRAERNLSAKPAITASTHVEKPIANCNTTDIPKVQVAKQQSTRRCPSNVPTNPSSNSGVRTIAKSGSSTLSENLRTDAGCGKPAKKSWAQVASSPGTIPVTAEPETTTASKESSAAPKVTATPKGVQQSLRIRQQLRGIQQQPLRGVQQQPLRGVQQSLRIRQHLRGIQQQP
ncbi:hypothetical protein BGX38DRAFT_1258764 [Terfezia claveryi]|nr:hypothetical protein BGX38DRAFT_1258764 [Terfezia claveryi]